jgi:hypothetical protein
VERSRIDSSPRQHAGTFFRKSVAVFGSKSNSAQDHPPYSPELAPPDFWLLPKVKEYANCKCFSDAENIKLSGGGGDERYS